MPSLRWPTYSAIAAFAALGLACLFALASKALMPVPPGTNPSAGKAQAAAAVADSKPVPDPVEAVQAAKRVSGGVMLTGGSARRGS